MKKWQMKALLLAALFIWISIGVTTGVDRVIAGEDPLPVFSRPTVVVGSNDPRFQRTGASLVKLDDLSSGIASAAAPVATAEVIIFGRCPQQLGISEAEMRNLFQKEKYIAALNCTLDDLVNSIGGVSAFAQDMIPPENALTLADYEQSVSDVLATSRTKNKGTNWAAIRNVRIGNSIYTGYDVGNGENFGNFVRDINLYAENNGYADPSEGW